MEAKNLRVGNIIKLGHKLATVSIVEDFEGTAAINELNQDMIDPLKINEGWLTAYGFKKIAGVWVINEHNTFIAISLGDNSFGIYSNEYNWNTGTGFNGGKLKVYFIHELQNLFFAITGKEIELKDESFKAAL